MTPVEKAKQLVDRFTPYAATGIMQQEDLSIVHINKAKQCALICVDEIIEEAQYWSRVWEEDDQKRIEELEKVKAEIEKL